MSFEQFPQSAPAEDKDEPLPTPKAEDAKAERPADRIGREEAAKLRPEIEGIVTRGLGDLFELLPKGRKAEEDDIVKLIEHTELSIMLPGMREKFAKEAVRQKINLIENKAAFITQSLETEAIKILIHLEALKGSSENVQARLREEHTRLAQLREEILGSQEQNPLS